MRITKIELSAFKAFPLLEVFDISKEVEINKNKKTQGQNLLLFGANGSGKSSLYQALFYMFSCNLLEKEHISQILHIDHAENIRNHYAKNEDKTFVRFSFDSGVSYTFSADIENQEDLKKTIEKGFESSEMMSYKLLHSFYYFRQEEDTNLFAIFKNEFFPFWKNDTGTKTYQQEYQELIERGEELKKDAIKKAEVRYKDFKQAVEDFGKQLETYLTNLIKPTNIWYQTLTDNQDKGLQIGFKFTEPMTINGYIIQVPKIELVLEAPNKQNISRPHTYLNESRLTMFALAIRLASFEKRLSESEFKILVLDDLLLSLDMNNRMKVFQHLLFSPAFNNYQKFIFTHDKGLFEVLKKNITLHQSSGSGWEFIELYANQDKTKNPLQIINKDYLVKAEEFFNEKKDFETAALYLRKKAEELISIYYDPELEKLSRYHILSKLANALKDSEIKKEAQYKMAEKLNDILENNNLSEENLKILFENAPQPTNSEELGKYNQFKTSLKNYFDEYLRTKKQNKKDLEALEKYAKKIDEARARILNAGAHTSSETPFFEWEIKGAIDELKEFQKAVLKITSQPR